ncbi:MULTISPECIES: phage tail protein [Helcococcus]|uniref:Phage tail protein n=1 Tax=Helcococcus bovis TaxID=3153252 RepID=A0ABW9F5M4_9FIRM
MYQIKYKDKTLYYPNDERCYLIDPELNLELNTAGTLSFIITKDHYMYDKLKNRDGIISVYKNNKKIFHGDIRSIEKDMSDNKKVTCVGELSFLADSIQPQKVYQNISVFSFFESLINQHNSQVEEKKRLEVGVVTVTDPNDSLYRMTNYETTFEAIKSKLLDRLGGFLRLRFEDKIYIDYINISDYGKNPNQAIQFGQNLMEFSDNLSSEDLVTAVLPLGAEVSKDIETKEELLKKHVNVSSMNNGDYFVKSDEAVKRFGFIAKVVKWQDVTLESNLYRKAKEYLSNNQFERLSLNLTALDLSEFGLDYESIDLGDRIRCISKDYGMDKVFPLLKQTIPIQRPWDMRLTLGETIELGFTQSINSSYSSMIKDIDERRIEDNSKLKSMIDELNRQMTTSQGGYKLTEYDENGRWVRDLYMDTMDKETATKILQINMNGIAGSTNGYKGPYVVGMTLDGMIKGERIGAKSITVDKLASDVGTSLDISSNVAIKQTVNNEKFNTYKEQTDKLIAQSVSVTDYNSNNENINKRITSFEQSSTEFELLFTNLKENIENNRTNIEELSAKIVSGMDDKGNTYTEWGSSGQLNKVRVGSDGISMISNEQETMKLRDGVVEANSLYVTRTIGFGNHVAERYKEEFTLFRWTGGVL